MSLDYPYYEKLCRQKHRAAWWWLIGDRLYYLGLLPAMTAVPAAGVALVGGLLGYGWVWLLTTAVVFASGLALFFLGTSLKGHAYTLGERDGISVGDA